MFWLFLTCKCNKQKSFNFRNFTKLFLCNIPSRETCSLGNQDSQIWVSRLHHWHKCTLHLLQRILVSPLHVRQWWSLEMWSWSRDFPFFESQSRRFEVLSWSAKIWLSKTFVNQRVFGLLYLQIETTKAGTKNARNSKKLQLRSCENIFWKFVEKYQHNPQILDCWVSDFSMRCRSRTFDQVSDSMLRSRLHHWC